MSESLTTLLPPTVLRNGKKTAAELPRAVMMRTNFIPGVRQRLGWRGVRACSGGRGAATMKITGCAGVFGLSRAEGCSREKRGWATFQLYYFPAPDEDLLESFSVAAGIEALREDFLDKVREFPRHASLQLFRLARLELEYDPATKGIELSVTAAERQLIRNAEGISVKDAQGLVKDVVAPGGIDQDLPAWSAIMPLFRTLAASFSFCLQEAPERLQHRRRRGRMFTCHGGDRMIEEPATNADERRLTLAWGAASERKTNVDGFSCLDLDWQAPAEIPVEYLAEPWWTSQVPGAGHSLDKLGLGIVERPKLIVLTGFLGAGKTSFLSHFIEYQAAKNAFVAVIQNEIGARGLDARLLGQHYAVTEMDEGCVCCSLAGNLKVALSEILSGFQPDYVVLETTGLANPANFFGELNELEEQLDFCSVVAVADGARGVEPLDRYPVARDQLVLADVVLINQIDRAAAGRVGELRTWIQAANPAAEIFETMHGDLSPTRLFSTDFGGRRKSPIQQEKPSPTHLELDISSLLVPLPGPLERQTFLAEAANLPPQVLRMKGIVQFSDDEATQIFQYVPGAQSLVKHRGVPADQLFLVLIGEQIRQSAAPFLQSLNLKAEG